MAEKAGEIMADQEKFSITKFFSSFFQWLPWVKTLRYVIGAIIILAVVFTVKAFFNKTQQQTNTITVQPGGVANIQQIQDGKKWLFLFAEPYVFAEAGSQSRSGMGVRGGVRLEW
jgi:hypothetical protein